MRTPRQHDRNKRGHAKAQNFRNSSEIGILKNA
jgi:hypothetical protein